MVSARRNYEETGTHLQHPDEIRDDLPVVVIQLILAELQIFVACDVVNSQTIIKCHLEHVVSGVPACLHITRDKSNAQRMGNAGLAPSRQGDCSRVNNRK